MRSTSKLLFGILVACGSRDATIAPAIEPESAVVEESPDDPGEVPGTNDVGGTGTAMALDEGKLGKRDSDRARAIEAARSAGVLGAGRGRGGYGSLTATGDISSGFDDRGVYGGLAGNSHRDHGRNPWTATAKDHVSTFAADVDTASYTLARRMLAEGTLPVAASVRPEEFVNYFHYALPDPGVGTPFSVVMDAAPSPLVPGRHVVRVAVGTKAKSAAERLPAHLTFLVDVSGSMDGPDRLGLAKRSLKLLVEELRDGDTVALVTYAGATRVVLPATGLAQRRRILAAIDQLASGGSTGMASGIDLAYREAMKGLVPGATSRVIVLSDGDANVGPTSHEDLLEIIAGRVKEGITLSTIGFGTGNYRDETMEQLADRGNGNNFYVDDIAAAKKIFQERVVSTLEVVAKDVKLQVDFDPQMVSRYRLVGYENRDIADRDFRNDRVDAGEVGAGHQVTALYEVELTAAGKQANAPLGGVRIRHKPPRGEKAPSAGREAIEAAFPMVGGPASRFAAASSELRFAFAVAAFADVLRGAPDARTWSLAEIRALARAAGGDADRVELVRLIDRAIALSGRTSS